MLQIMKKLLNTNNIEWELTIISLKIETRAVNEGKSSSASDRYYSIYKALHSFLFTMSILIELTNKCVENNVMLKRWMKVVPVILCKIPGNYNVEKLRVIQLIEADINFYFKLLRGKKLVRNMIKNNLFLPEQFGDCPGTLRMSMTLIKVPSFDLIRLLRASATIFNNDAKACYARVLPFLAVLCCIRLDLPQQAATFMIHFLRTAKYYVKTCYRVSNAYYRNLSQAISEVLQGSGAAPSI